MCFAIFLVCRFDDIQRIVGFFECLVRVSQDKCLYGVETVERIVEFIYIALSHMHTWPPKTLRLAADVEAQSLSKRHIQPWSATNVINLILVPPVCYIPPISSRYFTFSPPKINEALLR